MLLVQKFLETKTFGDLARDHGVYASFSKSGHKFSLNYDQIEARESDPLSQQCRGLILALKELFLLFFPQFLQNLSNLPFQESANFWPMPTARF